MVSRCSSVFTSQPFFRFTKIPLRRDFWLRPIACMQQRDRGWCRREMWVGLLRHLWLHVIMHVIPWIWMCLYVCRCQSICIMWLDGWKKRMIESWATSTRALSKFSIFISWICFFSKRKRLIFLLTFGKYWSLYMPNGFYYFFKNFFLLFRLRFHRKPLVSCVEKQLLGEHMTAILQKGEWCTLPVLWLSPVVCSGVLIILFAWKGVSFMLPLYDLKWIHPDGNLQEPVESMTKAKLDYKH